MKKKVPTNKVIKNNPVTTVTFQKFILLITVPITIRIIFLVAFNNTLIFVTFHIIGSIFVDIVTIHMVNTIESVMYTIHMDNTIIFTSINIVIIINIIVIVTIYFVVAFSTINIQFIITVLMFITNC